MTSWEQAYSAVYVAFYQSCGLFPRCTRPVFDPGSPVAFYHWIKALLINWTWRFSSQPFSGLFALNYWPKKPFIFLLLQEKINYPLEELRVDIVFLCISFVNGFYRGICYQKDWKRGSRRLRSDTKFNLGIREKKTTAKLKVERNFKLDFMKKNLWGKKPKKHFLFQKRITCRQIGSEKSLEALKKEAER